MHPYALQSSYASFRRPVQLPPHQQPMNATAHAAMYYASLSAAAAVDYHSVVPSTHQKRATIFDEFQAFLAKAPPGPYKRDAMTCTPEDVLAFFHADWLSRHPGSVTSTGHVMAAPSSVESALYTLSSCLQQLGRCSDWDPTTLIGNPIASHRISKWLLGYKTWAGHRAFRSTGAKEFTEPKIQLLMQHLHRQMQEPDLLHRHLIARDAFAFIFLWHTGCRGISAGDITGGDIQLLNGAPALPALQPSLLLTPGTVLKVTPQFLKTVVGVNREPVFITMQSSESKLMCPVAWLHLCLTTATSCSHPIGPRQHLSRTLEKGHKAMSTTKTSTSCLGKRLNTHLKAAGCYAGESMHSFRRGRAIADTAANVPDEEISRKLQHRSTRTLKRSYQPTGRHDSGVKRLRGQPLATGGMPAGLLPTPSPSSQELYPPVWYPWAPAMPPPPPAAAAAVARWPMGGPLHMGGSGWRAPGVPTAWTSSWAPGQPVGTPMPAVL